MFRLVLSLLLLLALPVAAETVPLGDRFYRIDLPQAPAGAPLIVALHGGGGGADQFARNSGLSAPANGQGYAVIYPEGTGRAATWNAGYCCGQAQRRRVDDLAFLDAVIADAIRRFGLNPARVYLTGMSNGAMMAETYAAQRPGKVRAVAGVAGTLDTARVTPKGPVPLLHIHGRADDRVPYAGGMGKGLRASFASVASVEAAFLAPFQMLARTERVIDRAEDGMRVVERNYADNAGVTQIRILTIEGGGHAWPGSRRAPRQGGTRDITANAEILRFFAEHP
ncbi:alpha/beta hydrolase family esterase [Fuscovulum ytuae]|uniref:PHB depolymerase family esterase n=1 Tax=Fuscovulum ytuae TaxID=3042299 RepID=A0ABY8Q857_9RHOB|nr:alpha/beta fold hydrolase [Fuscovulum sp. YMD61]WGV17019.1 PHB depolymerase family esterase [Fuscovulum sp. YMD61]